MSQTMYGAYAPQGGGASTPFRIKRGDTLPIFIASLTERDPDALDVNARRPLDLSQVSEAWMFAKTRDAKSKIAGQCSIRPADPGDPIWVQFPALVPYSYQVTYQWVVGDTSRAATYNGEIELRFAGGAKQTVPGSGYFQIVVEEDQG